MTFLSLSKSSDPDLASVVLALAIDRPIASKNLILENPRRSAKISSIWFVMNLLNPMLKCAMHAAGFGGAIYGVIAQGLRRGVRPAV